MDDKVAYNVAEYYVKKDNTVLLDKSYLEVRPKKDLKAIMISKLRNSEVNRYDKIIYKEIHTTDQIKIQKLIKQNKKYVVPESVLKRSEVAVNNYLKRNPDIVPTS